MANKVFYCLPLALQLFLFANFGAMIRSITTLIVCIFLALQATVAQGIAIGEWRVHLPYAESHSVAHAGDLVYCASEVGLFYYNTTDNSIATLSKVEGLSDVGFSKIGFDDNTNTLLIAYTNTNIDLIQNNQIINISDIKRKSILGNKTINNMYFREGYAYLACGFGIVVVDLVKREIKDTYIIGPNAADISVFAITSDDNYIYATTEFGVYYADLSNPNLANYNNWSKFSGIPDGEYRQIAYVNDKLYVQIEVQAHDTIYVRENNSWNVFDNNTHSDVEYMRELSNSKLVVCGFDYMDLYGAADTMENRVYDYFFAGPRPREVVVDGNGIYWVADKGSGLVQIELPFGYTPIIPNGPDDESVSAVAAGGGKIWAASGGRDDGWAPIGNSSGAYQFENGHWKSFNGKYVQGLAGVADMMAIAVNPFDPDEVCVASWGHGVIEFKDGQFSQIYNADNSTLDSLDVPNYYSLRTGGVAFDNQGNLWVTNSGEKEPFHVRKTNGEWKSFSPGNPSLWNKNEGANLVIDDFGQKWMVLRAVGLLVFDDNGTLDNTNDDKYKRVGGAIGSGNLPSTDIYSIAVDLDGEVWVGTAKGVAVFYSPGNVFSGSNFDAQQILVEQDGYAQYLLEAEIVTAIAIDGANRKWIGTQSAGVFLMSEDGTEEIQHFTEENSPLLSDNVTSIGIDHATGEVYFGTSMGIVSYKGTATGGTATIDEEEVYAYPNPVRNGYSGAIAIKGLVTNADVKITDVSGNLMYATTAEGGQAVWNGKNFDGEKAKTGIYLVFASNEDGSETVVTKILIVN